MTARGPDLDRAEDVLARYKLRRPDVVRLATTVCLAVQVEPGLLRLARRRLAPGVSVGAELELWFSPLVASRTVRGLMLDPGVAAALRRRLLADGRAFEAAHELVGRLHEHAPSTLKLEEEIIYTALTGREVAAGLLLEGALRTIAGDRERGVGIARWADRALSEMPAGVRDSPAARQLTAASRSFLAAPVTVGVQLTRVGIRISSPPASGAHMLELPPDPLWLEVRRAGSRKPPERIDIVEGRTVRRALDAATGIELRTADGRVTGLSLLSQRDRSRDGLANRAQRFVATGFRPWWRVVDRVPPVARAFNRTLINGAVKRLPIARPTDTSLAAVTAGRSSRLVAAAEVGASKLPPAERVSALFQRSDTIVSEKSTLLFAWLAQWFNESFVRCDHGDVGGLDITRPIGDQRADLSQLYGDTSRQTAALRATGGLLKSATINGEEYPPFLFDVEGRVKPEFDTLPFPATSDRLTAEQRRRVFATGSDTVGMHLASVVFNVLFLREHNRVARLLADNYPDWDDERLFQTTRNVLSIILVKLLVEEYLNHLSAYRFRFRFEPRSFQSASWQRSSPQPVDIALVYRWHSIVPTTIRIGGRDLAIQETLDSTETLTSHGLGSVVADASNQPAGRVSLFNTDDLLLRTTELQSVRAGRDARLGSYNEYRERCGFPRVTRIEQISSDPRVQHGLSSVYADVDDIELYPGLLAEDAVPNAVLPPLMDALVTGHMLSRLMSHPLLRAEVYDSEPFSPVAAEIIERTASFSDVVNRNIPSRGVPVLVSLTRRDWRPR